MLAHYPATPGEEPVTTVVFEARLDTRLKETENAMLKLHAKTLTWIITSLLGGLAIGMSAAAVISAALGGSPAGP